jgi:hypothetical protein
MKDQEHVELTLFYAILGHAAKLKAFWDECDFEFISSVARNIRSADGSERRKVAGFLDGCITRAPERGDRILQHLVLMLHEMAQPIAPPGVGTILWLLRKFAPQPHKLVAAHVLPLLGNPGLMFYSDVLMPWLRDLATDAAFRQVLLKALVRHFPQTNLRSTVAFLGLIGTVAISVPVPLHRRLLAVVASCLVRDDDSMNAMALSVFKNYNFEAILAGVQPTDAWPMLEILFVGASVKRETTSRIACLEALKLFGKRKPKTIRAFAAKYRDSASDKRERWLTIHRQAGAGAAINGTIRMNPDSARLAMDRETIDKIVARTA